MASKFLKSWSHLGIVLLWSVGTLGCSGNSLPPLANTEQARSALETALKAWQKGENISELSNGESRIYFNDPKCEYMKLLSYKLEDGDNYHGQSVRIVSQLSLQSKDGKTKERKSAYLIDTSPAIVIVAE